MKFDNYKYKTIKNIFLRLFLTRNILCLSLHDREIKYIEDSYNIKGDSYNIKEASYNIKEDSYNIKGDSYNIKGDSYNIKED